MHAKLFWVDLVLVLCRLRMSCGVSSVLVSCRLRVGFAPKMQSDSENVGMMFRMIEDVGGSWGKLRKLSDAEGR